MIDTREYISNLDMPEKVALFKELYNEIAGYGIEGDTELAHVNTFEASLLKSLGGSGTVNEITNLKEYFGGGGSQPAPPASQTVTQTSEFPTELKPFISDILGEARGEFGREKAEGVQAFPGPQLAGFTPEQQAAFAAGRQQFTGLAGTPLGQASTYYAPALAATALGTSEVGTQDIGRRMDPFLQNVVDVAKREARSDEDIARQRRAAQAVAGQGFLGGTRPAFVESQAEQDLAERLGDIQARGLSASFQQAQQAAEQQRAREMTGGRQFAALGDVTGARARSDISGLAGIGETQQQRSQQALDVAQREFEQERAFPQTALQRYASLIRGFPLQATQQQFATQSIPTPSFAQTLAGLGQVAAGTYGAFGGFKKKGGLVSLQGGGQPVGGQVVMGDAGGFGTTPMPTQEQFPNQANTALEMLRQRGAAIRQASMPQVPQVPQVEAPIRDPRLNRGLGVNLARNEGGLLSVVNRARGSTVDPYAAYMEDIGSYDTLLNLAEEQIGKQKTREQLLEESREHWREKQERTDERLRRAEELKKQKFWAGLAASGAGTLAADPRKGVWGAVGEGFQAGLPTWAEATSDYAEAEERAAEREEDIVSEKRSEELGLDRHDLETTLQQLKLKQIGTTNKKQAATLQATIQGLEAELAKWSFAYSYPQLDVPNMSSLFSQMELEYYGDAASNTEKKELANILDKAWRKVDNNLEALYREDPQATMPGENQLHKMIEDEYRQMAIDQGVEVIIGFDEKTGEYTRGPISEHGGTGSTREAISAMEEYLENDPQKDGESTWEWIKRVQPFSTDPKPLFW